MAYKFGKGKTYRMPTHFGPSLGPRQGEDGRKYLNLNSPKKTIVSVNFLTNRNQLENLLPKGFEIESEPVVTVEFQYITEIEWLAGRGYNTLGISFPASFRGKKSRVSGNFLAVLWENLADPIITGREELGFSKLYCEIPEIRKLNGKISCTANWMDFKFLDLRINNLVQVPAEKIKSSASSKKIEGTLHYKYIPKTEEWGEPDAEYAVLTPKDNPNSVVLEAWAGDGTLSFHKATWQELPTLVNVVNTIQTLEIKEYRGATLFKTIGGKDFGDQRIIM